MAGYFFLNVCCPVPYSQEAGTGRGKPKGIVGARPKNGLKLVHLARNRHGIAENSASEGRNDVSQRKTGGRPLKLQGSPKKAQGSGFGVGPCKRSIFKYWNQLRFGALKLFFLIPTSGELSGGRQKSRNIWNHCVLQVVWPRPNESTALGMKRESPLWQVVAST